METIAPTAAAVNKILSIDAYNRAGTLRLIGAVTDETVTFLQPAIHVDGTLRNNDRLETTLNHEVNMKIIIAYLTVLKKRWRKSLTVFTQE